MVQAETSGTYGDGLEVERKLVTIRGRMNAGRRAGAPFRRRLRALDGGATLSPRQVRKVRLA